MTAKLYISYYGDYVSIVEGTYNKKKEKFIIKEKFFLSNSDIDIDYDADKYELLRQALMRSQFKSKNVVLCFNTKDIILKSNKIPKVDKKDLEGIMNIEIYEMISLDKDSHVFSYEVTTEDEQDGTKFIEMILAAIPNNEIEKIIEVLKEFNLNLEVVDTIATSYLRVLKLIEYKDIMIANVGDYGTAIDIYKDDKLFIHDNVPIKLTSENSEYQSSNIATEVNGLMNYYSSRNFGKSVDKIVTIGKYAYNKDLENAFKMAFSSELVKGIENLFDIEESVKGNIKENEISLIVDALGCMLHNENKKGYSYMNLLPQELKSKQRKKEIIKKAYKIVPLILIILSIPYMFFIYSIDSKKEKLKNLNDDIKRIEIKNEEIVKIKKDINAKKEELKVYNMILSKQVTWGPILNSINSNIPYRVDITKLDVKYDEITNNKNNKTSDSNNEKEDKEPIYEQIPNMITIEGNSSSTRNVGQFVYELSTSSYFKDVKLQSIKKNEDKGTYEYVIKAYLKEGVMFNG
ncbi:MAG: PilN domain-containing protein [Peptostreptococcaceae bacterium]